MAVFDIMEALANVGDHEGLPNEQITSSETIQLHQRATRFLISAVAVAYRQRAWMLLLRAVNTMCYLIYSDHYTDISLPNCEMMGADVSILQKMDKQATQVSC